MDCNILPSARKAVGTARIRGNTVVRLSMILASILSFSLDLHADESLFPFSPGNTWRYECTFAAGNIPIHPGSHVCVKRSEEERLEASMTVTDMRDIAVSASGLTTELPEASVLQENQVYYTLTGDVVSLFFTPYQLLCSGLGVDSRADQVLVRVGERTEYSSREGLEEYPVDQKITGVWIRGVHASNQWWLFDQEHLLWDLSPSPGIPFFLFKIGDCVRWDIDRTWWPTNDDGTPATPSVRGYPVHHIVYAGTAQYLEEGPLTLYFSRGIGIVQISDFAFVEAVIDGQTVTVATMVSPRVWGAIKKQEKEEER